MPTVWFMKQLVSRRRLVETVITQVVEQFHSQAIRARTTWHVARRFMRKLLAHTLAFTINKKLNPDNPLQFEGLIE